MKKVVVISTSLRPGYRPPDIEELHEATIEILGGLLDLSFAGLDSRFFEMTADTMTFVSITA